MSNRWDNCMATETETLEFCNRVREAGGGDVLQELLPSTPQEQNACLIANGLNFDCAVAPFERGPDRREELERENGLEHEPWVMKVINGEDGLGDRIALELNLVVAGVTEEDSWNEWEEPEKEIEILLPERIANVARAFDATLEDDREGVEARETWVNKYNSRGIVL